MSKKLIPIAGNTYPVKDKLKEIGARWDSESKCWKINPDKIEEANKIVADAPIVAKDEKRPFVHHRCKGCGCPPTRYNPIYKSGYCRSCYQGEKEEREMGY